MWSPTLDCGRRKTNVRLDLGRGRLVQSLRNVYSNLFLQKPLQEKRPVCAHLGWRSYLAVGKIGGMVPRLSPSRRT
jgi:hypothetical protein